MEEDDDPLRYLFARAFEGATPTDDCPAPEALYDAALGVAPAADRAAIVGHLATCPVCAEAWRIAVLAENA
jgi:hypothetical protein